MTTRREDARRIADLLTIRYSRPDGLLARAADVEEGRITDGRLLFDELGDYAHYVALACPDDRKVRTWCRRQVAGGWRRCRVAGRWLQPFPDRRWMRRLSPTVRCGDTFWGLAEAVRLLGADLHPFFDAVVEPILTCGSHDGRPAYAVLAGAGAVLRFPLAEPMTAGYLAESLFEMAVTTGDSRYTVGADTVLRGWLASPGHRRHGDFPRVVEPPADLLRGLIDVQFRLRRRPGLDAAILTKGDVFLWFAMVNAHRRHGGLTPYLKRIGPHLRRLHLRSDNRLDNHHDHRSGARSSVALEENHSAVELLLDLAQVCDDDAALDLALSVLEAWLQRMDDHGLVPNRDGDAHRELDPNLDLAINVLKAGELTDDTDLTERGLDMIDACRAAFRRRHGWSDRSDHDRCQLKFLGLFIKGLLVADLVSEGGKIFASREHRLLATDR